MANNKTVLVIDDSPTVRRLAEVVLSQEGYAVFTAGDGDEGLQLARETVPSVIIVDFVMPKMNGFQFCKNIRSDSILGDIPIVLITSKGEDVGRGFDEKFGIVRYLQKPFESEALTKTVNEALADREREAAAGPEGAKAAEVPEHLDNDTRTDLHITSQAGSLAVDIPFVEINTTELVRTKAYAADSRPADGPLTNSPDTEVHLAGVSHPVSSPLPDTDADVVETDSHPAPPADGLPIDIPFVEINTAEFMHTKGCSADSRPADGHFTNAPGAEVEQTEESQTCSGDMSEVKIPDAGVPLYEESVPGASLNQGADTAPSVTPSTDDKPAESIYAAVQDNIEKEFRHYFGRELTVLLKNAVKQALKETDLVRSSRRILSGELTYFSVADILQFVSTAGLSGQLTVMTEEFNSAIYLEEGRVVFASISKHDYRKGLEELILKDGKPGRNEILSALSEARGNSLRGGSILVERGLITEDDLAECYRLMSEDAVQMTRSATSGRFYIEDTPLPREIRRSKMAVPSNGSKG